MYTYQQIFNKKGIADRLKYVISVCDKYKNEGNKICKKNIAKNTFDYGCGVSCIYAMRH